MISRSIQLCVSMKATILMMLLALVAHWAHGADDYLLPEEAFKFSAKMVDAKNVEITYAIADGYYMYRERFRFKSDDATLGLPSFPPGKVKFDQTFQKNVETFRHEITIKLPVEASHAFTLTSTGQGCADKGLCYAPMDSSIQLTPNARTGLLSAISTAQSQLNSTATQLPQNQTVFSWNKTESPPKVSSRIDTEISESGQIESALKGGDLLIILPLFLLLGLGLSFTPCVLPMVPILSFIIVGEGVQVSRTRGLALSTTYALGMALIYTALGIAAGLAGEGLSAALQNPWILSAFAALMVLLSLSMFGLYHLQVPPSMQSKLMAVSQKQKAGKLIGVFIMGAISALIIGPCVAAPLAGALVYISQTRDALVGGGALFSMAVGMSVPLLLVGVSAGALLPRAGPWMETVKKFFGVLMLAMALWIISPVIAAAAQMIGWSILGLGYGGYLLWTRAGRAPSKVFGVIFLLFGAAQLVGVVTGGRDVFAPVAHLTKSGIKKIEFTRINSSAELDRVVAQAGGKIVVLDFYADWCVSCKEMEKLTFSDPRVQSQFANMILLQADVTANNADDKALLKRFQLFGPPGIIFFDRQGQEVQDGRVIGFQNADKFSRSLSAVTQR